MLIGSPKVGGFIGRSWREPDQSMPSAGGDSLCAVDCHFELDDDGHDDHLEGVEVPYEVVAGDQLAMF